MHKIIAEMIGTFWLVLGGCGSAILAATFPEVGFGLVGVALAFGLTVVAMGYAIGHVSGCHLNPAVTIGLWAGGRFDSSDVLGYVVAQVLGAIFAGLVLYLIAIGKEGALLGGFASNGFNELSPGLYSLTAVIVAEVVMSAIFLFVIMGVTDHRAPEGIAPIAIGMCLTVIHLVTIPVSNTSVNPARSTGVAIFAETAALSQLWVFWLAPIVGAVCGSLIYKAVAEGEGKRSGSRW